MASRGAMCRIWGQRVVVVTDNERAQGQALAEQLAAEVYAQRDTLQPTYLTIDEALDRALAEPNGPVVLSGMCRTMQEVGTPNDSTFILRRVIDAAFLTWRLAAFGIPFWWRWRRRMARKWNARCGLVARWGRCRATRWI